MGPLLEVRWIWSWSWSWIDSGTRGRWHQWTLDFWLDFWYWATLGWVDWLSLTCEENYRVNIDKYFCNLYQLWNYHHGPVLVAYLHGRDIQFSCVPAAVLSQRGFSLPTWEQSTLTCKAGTSDSLAFLYYLKFSEHTFGLIGQYSCLHNQILLTAGSSGLHFSSWNLIFPNSIIEIIILLFSLPRFLSKFSRLATL